MVVVLSPRSFLDFLLSSMRAFVRSAQRSNQLRWHISKERKSATGRGCPFTSDQWNGQPFGTHHHSIKIVSCDQSTQVVWAEAEVLAASRQQHAATRVCGRRRVILASSAVRSAAGESSRAFGQGGAHLPAYFDLSPTMRVANSTHFWLRRNISTTVSDSGSLFLHAVYARIHSGDQ